MWSNTATVMFPLTAKVAVYVPARRVDQASQSSPLFRRFKGAQAWDIRYRVIYTERSHLGWWLEDWTKKSICIKCWADIGHFLFLAITEYAVKIIPPPPPAEYAAKIIPPPPLLSMPQKLFHIYWVCGKNYSTPTEYAVKSNPHLLSGR